MDYGPSGNFNEERVVCNDTARCCVPGCGDGISPIAGGRGGDLLRGMDVVE